MPHFFGKTGYFRVTLGHTWATNKVNGVAHSVNMYRTFRASLGTKLGDLCSKHLVTLSASKLTLKVVAYFLSVPGLQVVLIVQLPILVAPRLVGPLPMRYVDVSVYADLNE